MNTTNKEAAEQLKRLAEWIEQDHVAAYSVDFGESGGVRTITVVADSRGLSWNERAEDFLERLRKVKRPSGKGGER